MQSGPSLFKSNPRHQSLDQLQIPPLFVMLSGKPCTGKSTWRNQLLNHFDVLKFQAQVKIISSDDLAFKFMDELNNESKSEDAKKLTYHDMCNPPYNEKVEAKIKEEILAANQFWRGIVVLDRTFLTPQRRQEVLNLIDKNNPVTVVTFDIHDNKIWHQNLKDRNERNQDTGYIITESIVANLSVGATAPKLEEGFKKIIHCPSIGEEGWQKAFALTQIEVKKQQQLHRYHTIVNVGSVHPSPAHSL